MVNNERGAGSARQNEYSQRQTASFRMNYSSIILMKKICRIMYKNATLFPSIAGLF